MAFVQLPELRHDRIQQESGTYIFNDIARFNICCISVFLFAKITFAEQFFYGWYLAFALAEVEIWVRDYECPALGWAVSLTYQCLLWSLTHQIAANAVHVDVKTRKLIGWFLKHSHHLCVIWVILAAQCNLKFTGSHAWIEFKISIIRILNRKMDFLIYHALLL